MKKILLLSILGMGFISAQAQSGVVAKANADAVANYDGVRGIFTYPISTTERVSVSYGITPKNPTTTANLLIHTPNAMPFRAKIFNSAGKEVLNWKPAKEVYLYQEALNVSKFTAGVYTVNIYMGTNPNAIHSFEFQKL